jgi:hypothetical protein
MTKQKMTYRRHISAVVENIKDHQRHLWTRLNQKDGEAMKRLKANNIFHSFFHTGKSHFSADFQGQECIMQP